MKKRRTEQEINDIKVFAEEVELDPRIASLCKTKYQVKKLLEIQKSLDERSSGYLYLKQIAPKERVKEYKAALKHKKLLAVYLFESRQRDALHALNNIEIKENEPRAQDFITRNKEYIAEEAENLNFNKISIKEIVSVLIEYLEGKFSEYIMPGSIAKQLKLK